MKLHHLGDDDEFTGEEGADDRPRSSSTEIFGISRSGLLVPPVSHYPPPPPPSSAKMGSRIMGRYWALDSWASTEDINIRSRPGPSEEAQNDRL